MTTRATQVHIVHIIPTLRYGGAERLVVSLANNASSGIRHSIITLFDDMPLRSELPKNVPVRVVPKKGRLSLHLFRDLERALREMNPDVVHTHLSGGDIWGRVAARRIGVPIVSTQHNVVHDNGKIKRCVMRCMRTYADVYVACSDAAKISISHQYGVPADAIRVIRNGIDVARFAAVKKHRWHAPIRFVIIGRLASQKGHSIALHALASLTQQPWSLTIVGDGELGPSLAQLAHTLGIADRITFTPAQADVPALLDAHDIVLMPSRWEGLGVVAMEAMAAGRLVVVSDIDGLRESIRNKETGLLVAPEDDKALAETIAWAMIHEKESAVLAHAGQDYAKAHFSLSYMVQAYEKIYKDIKRNASLRA